MSTPRANILIVDDRPANLVALEALLQPLEQNVVRAQSGQRALELAHELDFAVILLDVQMPTLDGFETTRLLRESERTRAVPVILLTAIHDGIENVTRGYSLGVVDYLTKPYPPDFLVAKVGAFVAWYQQRRELARKQAALEAAELAHRAKDEFLAMVSHELRTPLAAVIGWAEMLAKGQLDGDGVLEAGQAILGSAHAQSRLVEDLLDVSRMVAGTLTIERRALDLAEVVRAAVDALRPLAADKQLVVRARAEAPAPLEGDGARLQQVVWNLLSNAIHFTPHRRTIDIALTRRARGHELVVRDEGIGIDAALLPYVFDRFRQGERSRARKGGLGLGLAIAQHIVHAHGGTIDARSDGPGRGATFTVMLPTAI